MSISTINAYYDATDTAATTSSTASSIDSTEFLMLMVEQLQNQDPTEPADTSQYISQMVDYANFETSSEVSDQIADINTTLAGLMNAQGMGYIGQTVEATGNTTSLQDGAAEWAYTLDSEAENVTVNIYNEDGALVYSQDGETDAGAHSFTWDGVTTGGEQLEDGGQYTIEVEAMDAAGEEISGYTTIVGKVTAVDTSGDAAVLGVGDASILMSNILAVKAVN